MRIAMFFLCVFFVSAADQLAKFFAPKFFTVSYNSGIAWSIPIPNEFVIAFAVIFFVVAGFLALRLNFSWRFNLVLGLLFGGALGNFIDRLVFGAVRDFVRIGNFPAFNLADACITVSIFCLILFYDRITYKQ